MAFCIWVSRQMIPMKCLCSSKLISWARDILSMLVHFVGSDMSTVYLGRFFKWFQALKIVSWMIRRNLKWLKSPNWWVVSILFIIAYYSWLSRFRRAFLVLGQMTPKGSRILSSTGLFLLDRLSTLLLHATSRWTAGLIMNVPAHFYVLLGWIGQILSISIALVSQAAAHTLIQPLAPKRNFEAARWRLLETNGLFSFMPIANTMLRMRGRAFSEVLSWYPWVIFFY